MLKAYLELTKPRITTLVAATAAVGWVLAGGAFSGRMALLLAGTALASAAAGALNQYLERDQDALMERTRGRPLPSRRLAPAPALRFGLALGAAGLGVTLFVGWLACALTAATLALYLAAYTPLKRRTPQCAWPGAVAGATPPLIGWAGAGGRMNSPLLWALFGIQLFWQMDHFLALFRIYREEYRRAGFRVLPAVDGDGGATAAQMAVHGLTVLLASMAPYLLGCAGLGYGLGALAVSTLYLAVSMRASWTLAAPDTRRLFLASLAYLPLLFSMLLLGGVP